MIRTSRGLSLAFATLLVAACSDGPTGPQFPDVVGSYAVTERLSLDAGELGSATGVCTGTITISNQTEGSFSGSFITDAGEDCGSASGTVSGDVRLDGGINFSMETPGAGGDIEAITGCKLLSADDQYNGTFSNGRIEVSADAVLDCFTQFGVVRMNLGIDITAVRTN